MYKKGSGTVVRDLDDSLHIASSAVVADPADKIVATLIGRCLPFVRTRCAWWDMRTFKRERSH